MSLDCLNNIIGLSPSDCNCWDASKPIDFNDLNESSSGLYVSQADTIPLRWTNSAADCENGGLWDLLITARNSAVRDLLSDYLASTQEVKSERFLPFTAIGDNYYKQAEQVKPTATHAAVWIEPYELRGAKIKVESVDIAFWDGIAGSTDVDIEVYSSLDFTNPIDTATATVTGNKQYFTATFSTPIEIDLGSIRSDLNERIYFVYSIPVGARPVKNQTEKGCQCSQQTKVRNNPYLQVLCLGGVQSDSVANLETPITGTSTMQGLVINASLECDYYSWLCDLAQTPNVVTSVNGSGQRLRLGMVLADGLQAKSVVNLIQSIITSSRINHFTMVLGVEELYRMQNHFKKIYQMAIRNLVYYMPSDVSDCLICANDKRMTKGQILV